MAPLRHLQNHLRIKIHYVYADMPYDIYYGHISYMYTLMWYKYNIPFPKVLQYYSISCINWVDIYHQVMKWFIPSFNHISTFILNWGGWGTSARQRSPNGPFADNMPSPHRPVGRYVNNRYTGALICAHGALGAPWIVWGFDHKLYLKWFAIHLVESNDMSQISHH